MANAVCYGPSGLSSYGLGHVPVRPGTDAAVPTEDTGFLFTKFIDKAREYKRFGRADSVLNRDLASTAP